ncbi:hypothetical protein BTR25_03510 [Bacillus sp. MRMR6]|nr:hypothetical protein BTR25_03510 [Bacillus sp. MRMR6]
MVPPLNSILVNTMTLLELVEPIKIDYITGRKFREDFIFLSEIQKPFMKTESTRVSLFQSS